MKLREQKGFTLIEVIVVAGIIAVLAGILVPLIFKEIDESKTSRAYADVRSISNAMIILKKDVGDWPVNANCTPNVTMLIGGGNLPTINGAGWDSTTTGVLSDYLTVDDNACWDPNIWKGAYMGMVSPDPWGHNYIVNAKDFSTAKAPIWIISAGPDGILDTGSADGPASGDDVGVRLR